MTKDTKADKNEKHKAAMKKQQENVHESIERANVEKSVVVLLTGNGKGKSSSAFGMVMRALGYGQKVAVIQFIKGVQKSGEELFIANHLPEVFFYQMNTGFTWDTQDRSKDEQAARKTWEKAAQALSNPEYDLVVLDELTYMLSFKYLDEQTVLDTINARPEHQSVVITGRGGGAQLRDLADTVSEVKDVKHAFNYGVAARKGVDF